MSFKNDATVWTCDHCGYQEYNSGDYMPSGWVAFAVHNNNPTLIGAPTLHLCHNCVMVRVVDILEEIIAKTVDSALVNV